MCEAIYFDMDGTLASLYDYPNWLELLHAEDTTPYEKCGVLVDIEELKDVLSEFVLLGVTIGIISWGAMGGSKEYCKRTRKAKKEWCEKYFPGVFKEFHVVKYDTPKHYVRKIKNSILVDDNADVRRAWRGKTIDASNPTKTIEYLRGLLETVKAA